MYRIAALIVAATLALPALAAERMLQKEVVVKAPLPAVWDAWTTTEGIKTFFAPDGLVEARPDGPFQIYINPYGAPGMKGADDMRVLAVQPLRMLSFTWNAPPSLPEARKQRTVVIVRFESVGENETRVTLTHVGWGDGGEWDKTYAYFDNAWKMVLGNLQKRFETGPIDWTDWLAQLKARTHAK
jgi:uncharacterized protein YndB with AHSA1/START domain